MDLGLDRIKTCLSNLPKNPTKYLKIVHVTGTNGKGSVCALISNTIQASGYKVATYNSPHFIEPRDAIRINDCIISQRDYQEIENMITDWEKFVLSASSFTGGSDEGLGSPGFGTLTSFEKITVIALCWFMLESVDLAVIEVGMGGLRDATNVFDSDQNDNSIPTLDFDQLSECIIAKWRIRDNAGNSDSKNKPQSSTSLVQCFTPISLDHVGMIGNNVTEITYEKSGIIKPNSTVIIGKQSPTSEVDITKTISDLAINKYKAKYVVNVALLSKSSEIKLITKDNTRYIEIATPNVDSNNSNNNNSGETVKIELPIILPGSHQIDNALIAYYALLSLRNDFGWDKITPQSMFAGFINVNWPGRLTPLSIDLTSSNILPNNEKRSELDVIVDGAHNPEASIVLRNYIDSIITSTPCNYDSKANEKEKKAKVCWILGFTKGKDIKSILEVLIKDNKDDLVWFVPFNPPVGMSWISSATSQDCKTAALDNSTNISTKNQHDNYRYFDSLKDALIERYKLGNEVDGQKTVTVVAGSLYLAADLYRLAGVKPWKEYSGSM